MKWLTKLWAKFRKPNLNLPYCIFEDSTSGFIVTANELLALSVQFEIKKKLNGWALITEVTNEHDKLVWYVVEGRCDKLEKLFHKQGFPPPSADMVAYYAHVPMHVLAKEFRQYIDYRPVSD